MKRIKKLRIILIVTIFSLMLMTPKSWQVYAAKSEIITNVATTEKVIALTFDDNYYEGTQEIVTILNSYNVKASFFYLGITAETSESLVQELYAAGHFIGNHSYAHPHFTTLDQAGIIEQLQLTETIITNLTGEGTMPYFRPPYGDYNDFVLQVAGDAGYTKTILWSIDSEDYTNNSAADIVNRVVGNAAPGAIVLMHCGITGTNTTEALPTIIEQLLAQGYTFVTIPELLTYGNAQALTNPSISITTPASGLVSNSGTSISFRATANDNEDGNLDASIKWKSSLNGEFGIGPNVTTNRLVTGTHIITAWVKDSNGLSASESIEVTINAPAATPTISITNPASGLVIGSGNTIYFKASATDSQGGNLDASIKWKSSLNGEFGIGSSAPTSKLVVGTHTITATAKDSNGVSASTSIEVTISGDNAAPTVSITNPTNGLVVASGSSIYFNALASDSNGVDITSSIKWKSSLNGEFGIGPSVAITKLAIGTHTITATAKDSSGASASTSIVVTITAENTAPTISITNPTSGLVATSGTNIYFRATASDNEEGNIDSAIKWKSSLNGEFGIGPSAPTTRLAVGTHTITATVKDGSGVSASSTITVTIEAN